jgi:hypothetical protein
MLAEAGEAPDADARPAYDPHRSVRKSGVLDVGVRDVLKPSSQRIEPDPARWRAVGQPGPRAAREDSGARRRGRELCQLVDIHERPCCPITG